MSPLPPGLTPCGCADERQRRARRETSDDGECRELSREVHTQDPQRSAVSALHAAARSNHHNTSISILARHYTELIMARGAANVIANVRQILGSE